MRPLALLLPLVLAAQTSEYTIQPGSGNRFALEVYKTKLWEGRKHVFVYDRFQGKAAIDPAHPEHSSVHFTVEAASIRCTDDWVKPGQVKDIEKAALDTMDATAHPQITFDSTSVTQRAPNQYDVQGTLTIRGKAKPVKVSVTTVERAGGLRAEGTALIKLSDYGLKAPSGMVGLFIGTKDEMKAVFELQVTAR